MPFGFIQGTGGFSASNTSQAFTFGGAVTAGSCLALAMRSNSQSITGVTDNVNGAVAWTQVRQTAWNALGNQLSVYIFPNTASGTPTVTATFAAASSVDFAIAEYGGVATSSPVDVSAIQYNDTAGTAVSLPSITTTNANDVLIGVYVLQNGVTWTDNVAGSTPNTWTNRIGADGNIIWWNDVIVSSTGTYFENATLSASETYASCQFALKQFVAADVLMPQAWM
ncbi:hypothetical protein [Bradyrhizobium sp. Tv2a-2]|uniref:hypothetical protein n=1 Tax=Bradyrhizobium sp. Tv2a-2 TaxID=113395 RepID=UPI00046521B7|nr:hypothetical protein [Bradyrhizobium sp. Tv2a-2]